MQRNWRDSCWKDRGCIRTRAGEVDLEGVEEVDLWGMWEGASRGVGYDVVRGVKEDVVRGAWGAREVGWGWPREVFPRYDWG